MIDEAKARERRKRSLPTRLTDCLVLAMWLWREHGYEEVLRQLIDGLAWPGAEGDGPDEADVAWSGSITRARARLGPDPLRLMFARVADPTGGPEVPGCFWRGLRLSVIDGSTMDVPDSDENRAAFDGPSNDGGLGALPQVRLLVHAECGSKALLGAAFDGYRAAETVLAQGVLDSFGPGMLKPPRKKDGDPITVRVIEYTVTTRDEHGEHHSELFCLATTLLDPEAWPIEQIPALYHERWRGETLLDVVKTDVHGGADVLLRSHSPAGARQEMWALFCLYQALAHLVSDAARHYRIDPDRISFPRARNAARRSAPRIQRTFSPSPDATRPRPARTIQPPSHQTTHQPQPHPRRSTRDTAGNPHDHHPPSQASTSHDRLRKRHYPSTPPGRSVRQLTSVP
ncbi:transposase domain-containing protein [Micromonospora sp. CA-263727]|uniref:transposase domain-containing protein n=1 Tax=Micromonospora sp. CA-263727 TaxID=3239967 RepID=UPI003D92BBE4